MTTRAGPYAPAPVHAAHSTAAAHGMAGRITATRPQHQGDSLGRAATGARAVGLWLLSIAGLVFAMAVIGAITRLTESGLSMVEWRPLIGILPPLSEAEWERVFALYRDTAEFRTRTFWMQLPDFQRIYFWEWLHRFWGQLIGLAFIVPYLWFLLRRRVPAGWGVPLFGLLALGGLQGIVGAWMVASGLADIAAVSHYRLATHLGLALVIYALTLYAAARLLWPSAGGVRAVPLLLAGPVALTVLWGALVAGLDAGHAYNTWPLMEGRLLPPEALSQQPWALNLIDNTAMVQFIHRWLAVATAVLVAAVAWRQQARAAMAGPVRGLWRLLIGAILAQVALGIATLLLAVPVWLGALHQAGALVIIAILALLTALDRQKLPIRQQSIS